MYCVCSVLICRCVCARARTQTHKIANEERRLRSMEMNLFRRDAGGPQQWRRRQRWKITSRLKYNRSVGCYLLWSFFVGSFSLKGHFFCCRARFRVIHNVYMYFRLFELLHFPKKTKRIHKRKEEITKNIVSPFFSALFAHTHRAEKWRNKEWIRNKWLEFRCYMP